MKILCLLSAILAAVFFIGGIYSLTRNRKSILNVFSFLVLISLGWWNFCNYFFFSAATESQAWMWHHLASIGWVGFIAETTYYFIALTGINEKFKNIWIQILFYTLPSLLLIYNIFAKKTSLAVDIARSNIGNTWTYINSYKNIWLWIFLFCLCLYFSYSFLILIRWSIKVKHQLKKRMAIGFVILDVTTIVLGFFTDVLFPLNDYGIPPIANLCTALFSGGYFFIILHYDLFNLRHVVKEKDILDHSMEPILVTDEYGEILIANAACTRLFETVDNQLIGSNLNSYFKDNTDKKVIMEAFKCSDLVKDIELSIPIHNNYNKTVLISGSVLRDKRHEYLGTVISLRDVTQLNQLKERYRIQSDEYQKLAYIDTLTGLPNRRKTFEVLAERADKYEKDKTDFYILYMDVDNFKSVNDIYGHQSGDLFLIEVTSRLKSCLCDKVDFIGRLGGDELLMIGGSDSSPNTIQNYKIKIEKAFESEFVINDFIIKSEISVGFARYSDYRDIDTMVHSADEEMYMIKNSKKKQI